MSYLTRFNQLAEELTAHPKIRLLSYQTFAAVTSSQFEILEQQLGQPISDQIKAFYLETNGLQLRWIFENNEDLDEQQHQFSSLPKSWNYATQTFRVEDGIIFILPIQDVFTTDFAAQLDLSVGQETIEFAEQTFDLSVFYKKIKPFDAFSSYCNMAFYMDGSSYPPLLMGDEQRLNFTDSRFTDFQSYLEFLLATKGICRRRKSFYGQYQGYKLPLLQTNEAYWKNLKDEISLDQMVFEDEFPLANQLGVSTSGIKTKAMQEAAFKKAPMTKAALETILKEHNKFLVAGGAGGQWQLLLVNGQVLGTYKTNSPIKEQQAIFDMLHLNLELDLQELQLPYSSWCGAWLKYQNFSESDLEGSIFVDAMLDKSIFADANLRGTDFSRASLRGASFMNANLSGADFENCDLRDADFRGANLAGARFPGAILENIQR